MSLVYARGKRGVDASLFTWILATVAGAVLFLFFYRFAFQHVELSTTLSNRQSLEQMNDELGALGVSDSASKTLQFDEETSLLFSCGALGREGQIRTTPHLLFAPPRLTGKSITLWTEEWSFPFPIANFFYAGNPRTRIVVVYDDRSLEFVQQLPLPRTFHFQAVHIRNLDLQELARHGSTLDSLTLVYLLPLQHPDAVLSAFPTLQPHLVEVNLVAHTLTLFPQRLSTFYAGDEMLYGMFFAPEHYGCLKEAALERLRSVASVLDQRARLLRGKVKDPFCSEQLYKVSNALTTFIAAEEKDALYDSMRSIQEHNNLLKKSS